MLNLIKGRKVEDALNTLVFTKKRVAATVEKLLRSALENANYLSSEKGIDVDVDKLYVKDAVANDGPRMKRIRPAPMGRAFRYVRRIAHIEIVLAERGKSGESLATVVGEESAAARTKTPARAKGKAMRPSAKRRRQEESRSQIMGQKVHPYGFRLGYTKPWKSRWFVERDYDKLLLEDVKLSNELKDKLKSAGVSSIEIERPGNKLRVIIKTARPGIIIGRKGAEIDKLKQDVQKRTGARGLHRYPGSAQAGTGRATGVGVDRAATGKARGLPPRHAQGGGFGAALRLQGNQGPGQRTPERQRNRAFGVVSAGTFAAAHAARRHRLRFYRSPHHLRRDRGEVLGLQRRNFAGQKTRTAAGRRVLKDLAEKLEAKS